MNYLPRIVDAELTELLRASGAVLVEGPRACGKTATAMQAAASAVLFDVDDNARRMMGADPAAVLAGDTPRLIDEWQLEPAVWNHVRRAVDRRGDPGRFILAGSAVPADDVTRHTGAGRERPCEWRDFAPAALRRRAAAGGAVRTVDSGRRGSRLRRRLAGPRRPGAAGDPARGPRLSGRRLPHRRLASQRQDARSRQGGAPAAVAGA